MKTGKKRSPRKTVASIGKYVLIYTVLACILLPFLWMVLASFQTQADILNSDKGIFDFVPTFENYISVIAEYDFIKPMMNSVIVAALSTLFALILGLPAAYAISRYKLDRLGLIILLVRMIPSISFLIPWFTMFTYMGLSDTITAMVLAHMLVALPFVIWIMEPNFGSLPHALEEAAEIDGCTKVQTFFRVVLPISRTAIITAALLSFIFSWNNFMFSLVLSGKNSITLPMAVFSFISYASVDWGGLMAASVMITLPIIALSLFLQKYIVQGLTAGAVKG